MAHRKNKNSRPAREPAPKPANPLLPEGLQKERYRVCSFTLGPELELLTPEGVVKRRIRAAGAVAVFPIDFEKSLRQIMADEKLKMESHTP